MEKQTLNTITSEPLHRVTFGGWYQRTTLHLSEIFEFFSHANSYLKLDHHKLKELHDKLAIVQVERKLGNLEYVEATTKEGINIKYYEDGLYVLAKDSANISETAKELETYFNTCLTPATSYLFSLGAPTPKILANIKTKHPVVISYQGDIDTNALGWMPNIYSKINLPGLQVYKSNEYILIAGTKLSEQSVNDMVEMQIFFREFKDQLEKYLNIHRTIWEEISTIKDKQDIKLKDLPELRKKLDSYQKAISLISNRINQMSAYARTRQSIAKQSGIEQQLVSLFQYRFEVLLDTLDYIKEIWRMTTDYVNSAIQVIVEAQNLASTKNIQSLTLITTIGVIAGLIGHLSRESYPKITPIGAIYLSGLLLLGIIANYAIQYYSNNKKQQLKFNEREKEI